MPGPLGLRGRRLVHSEELAVDDNLSGKLHLIVYADPSQPDAYARAMRRLQELRAQLRKSAELPAHAHEPALAAPRSNIGEQAFYDAVAKCKRLILHGPTIQAQLSPRPTPPAPTPPFHLSRALP